MLTESADVQKCFCEMRPFEEKGTMDIKKKAEYFSSE